MKKIFSYIVSFGLSLLAFFSCQSPYLGIDKPVSNPVSTMKGVFYTSVTDGGKTIKVLAGKSKTMEVHVCASEGAVSDVTLTISLAVDPEGVAVYNAAHTDEPAELLPAAAYTFVNNDLMLARYNTASSAGRVKITANELEDEKLYVLPLTIGKVEGTDNWSLADQPFGFITVMQSLEGPEGGNGSMEFPFELRDTADMRKMKKHLSAEEKIYFKLMNDIDMADVDDWEPLNWSGTYDKAIDFDGQGYTIDNFHVTDFGTYASFFGVLNGYCHDVTFTNAYIECASDSGCGILGGYAGSGDKHADVARVHVQGKVKFTGNKTGIGGMFGCAGNATIEGCSCDVDVWSGKNYVGGMIGYSKKVQISNCWVAGSVRGDQRVGGIAGGINGEGDAIINSYCVAKIYSEVESIAADAAGGLKLDQKSGTANIVFYWATENDGLKVNDAVFVDSDKTVAASDGDYTKGVNTITVAAGKVTQIREYGVLRSVGGIVGHANQDKGDTPGSRTPGNVVSGCIVWMDAIKTRTWLPGSIEITSEPDKNNYYSSGAIVGFGASHNTYENCYHNADLIFRDYCEAFKLYNQDNSTPASPLVYQEVTGSSYNFPYHGKSAATGKTVSQLAQDLGWDAAIWDFSTELPTIKANAPVGPIPDVTGNGNLPGFNENDLN